MSGPAEMGASYQDDLPLMAEHPPDFEEKVSTTYGTIKVTVYGNRRNRAIVTFHDLGLDSETNFQNFFQYSTAGEFLSNFCIYNINAPGQSVDSQPLADNYAYPTMDGLAQIVSTCVEHLGLSHFIGLGVGVGANVMVRYALQRQAKVDALILVNCVGTSAGWIEWFYQQINIKSLRARGMTSFTVDYLMWHHFGNHIMHNPLDTLRRYRAYFLRLPNPKNLAAFIECYLNRTPLVFSRDGTAGPKLNVPVLQIVGADSAFVDDTVEVNARLNPGDSEWLKLSGSGGLVLDDKPEGVAQAVFLFLQGRGYVPTSNVREIVRKISVQSAYDCDESLTTVETISEIS